MAKLKFIGKKSIRTSIQEGKELNLHPGEIYDDSDLTNAYLCGLIAQGFFELIEDPKKEDTKPELKPKEEPKPKTNDKNA
jgi:hypothetical protein